MGDARTRTGGTLGCLRVAGALAAAAIGFSAPSLAQAPSPPPESGARGAPGVIVQYQEAPGTNVLYLEEKGGMASAVAPLVPAGRQAPLVPAGRQAPLDSPARKARAAAEASPAKVPAAPMPRAQRRLAARGDLARQP